MPHPAQQQILNEARRFNVCTCGRRAGKTSLFINCAADCAIRGYPVGWFAPTYKILDDAWYRLRDALAPYTLHKDESKYRLDLVGGGSIECWSLNNNPDAGRSRAYKRVIVDEAAMVPQLETVWTQAIQPTLTDLIGDAWFGSTPRGPGYYKTLHDRGQDPLFADWASWQLPTVSNPYINADEIERVKGELPAIVFDQEYLARFNLQWGAVFRRIEDLCVHEPQDPVKHHQYSIGVDWGKTNDFTAISVIDLVDRQEVRLERFNQIDYLFQIERLETIVNEFNPIVIIPEYNSVGIPIMEILERKWGDRVIPFHTNNATKKYAIEGMSVMMDRSRIRFLHDPVATAELQAFEAKRLPTGAFQYNAPKGQHDDTVIARALAVSPLIDDVSYSVPQTTTYYDPVSIGPNI